MKINLPPSTFIKILENALLLLLPVFLFWRPFFFYVMDDWTALIQMVEYPFGRYLLAPDGEQWFPFLHLVFYGLVKMAGERYWLLVLVNCLGTGINACLVNLFFRRHLSPGVALVLSLFYAGAAVHHAIAWNAFYICYLLSLGFFLGALLLTDAYGRAPAARKLWGIGLFSLLSVLSHNYTLTGLLALPLYLLLLGGPAGRRQFKAVAGVVGAVYLAFAAGYFAFAGRAAAASHNAQVFSGLPSPLYLVHLFYGAVLAPFLYLFWGHYHFPPAAFAAGAALLLGCLALIWRWGGPREKHLALWALLANALPFVLVSLTRYQRSVSQAAGPRYGIFTLVGVLLLAGLAWSLLAARFQKRRWPRYLAVGLLAVMVVGQAFSLPRWQEKFLEMSRSAKNCYTRLTAPGPAPEIAPEEYKKFCPTAHPRLTPGQAAAIRRFLQGLPDAS